MTYYSSFSTFSVDDLRSSAEMLSGTATAVFPGHDNSGTFWWKIATPNIGDHIYALPDATVTDYGGGYYDLIDVVGLNDVTVYQAYRHYDPLLGESFSIAPISSSSTLKEDTVLTSQYPAAMSKSHFVDGVVGPGHSSAENTASITWLDEFYVAVDGDAGYFDAAHAQFGMNAPNDGRFLISYGKASGMRDSAWGNWLDTQTFRFIQYPEGVDQTDVNEANGVLQGLLDGSGAPPVETPEVAESNEFVPVQKLTKDAGFDFLKNYASVTKNMFNAADKVNKDPDIALKVFNGALPFESVKSLANKISWGLRAADGAISAYNEYNKSGSVTKAFASGGAEVAISFLSGKVGTIVSGYTAVAVAGVVATGGLPVLAGMGIALGAGVVATAVAEGVLRYAYDEAPDWYQSLTQAEIAPMNAQISAQATAMNAPAQVAPAWIYNADTGKMLLSLEDTDPELYKEIATRAFLTDVVKIKPVKLSLAGDDESDQISGGNNNDTIIGGGGHDSLAGAKGNDRISGDDGDDRLFGHDGKDTLGGGAGKDNLTGGKQADRFVFASLDAPDTIKDFKHNEDRIALDDLVFTGIGTKLDGREFYAKAGAKQANDSSDRIVYDKKSGKLYFDSDGKDGEAAIHFATLSGKPALDAGDFLIV